MQHFIKMYILVLNRLQLPQTCLAGMVFTKIFMYATYYIVNVVFLEILKAMLAWN